MSVPFWNPKPAPPTTFQGQPLPYKKSGLVSKFLLNWAEPSVKVAYSRAIEEDDLYDLTEELQAKRAGDKLEGNFMKRVPPEFRPARYRPENEFTHLLDLNDGSGQVVVAHDRTYDQSLFKAIYSTIWKEWWWMNIIKLIGLGLRTLAPLVMREILTQTTRAYKWHHALNSGHNIDHLVPPKPVGYMVSLGFTLWIMLTVASSLLYYENWRVKVTGKLMNSAITNMISRKAMRLSGKSRIKMTDGRITTLVSVDTAFIDTAVDHSTEIMCTPAQVLASVAVLCWQLGYSAFVGLGVILMVIPLKVVMFKYISKLRKAQNEVVDERVRLLSEALSNIRAVKMYAYESWFGDKIGDLRKKELKRFLSTNLVKSCLTAVMGFIPTLAAISTFITYALLGHNLDAAVIFSSLQYFNNIKNPISVLPEILSTLSQATAGLARINELLIAEELKSEVHIDTNAKYAIEAKGSFQIESDTDNKVENPHFVGDKGMLRQVQTLWRKLRNMISPTSHSYTLIENSENTEVAEPFSLNGVDLKIPRGALVCVVGRIGTGKTALLSGLINEMKQTEGHVCFGGNVSYVPQQAWVQSGSIRENITFSADPEVTDLGRVEEVIEACALREDIDAWAEKDLTKIGERGITLSGGQRQRLCIARAAYEKSDIVLLDDPLSAVDAHVGRHLLDKCILQGPLSDRTRVLVIHHLEVLPKADLILVLDRDENGNGKIVQQGSYQNLLSQEGTFESLIDQYGTKSPSEGAGDVQLLPLEKGTSEKGEDDLSSVQKSDSGKFFIEEEKVEGDVSSQVYMKYLNAIGSPSLITLFSSLFILSQAATVLNTLFLGYWSEDRFAGLSKGAYMGIYAGLGIAMAIFTWGAIFTLFLAGIKASFHMFNKAWYRVMRSPTSWHDRTPTGRIINRLSKDIEILDDKIAATWFNVLSGILGILGAISLVLYTYPLAGLIFIPILYFDYITVLFYRKTSREINKLVSVLRSHIYTNLGEQLAGLPIIRAFGRQEVFEGRLQNSLDVHLSAVMISGFTQGFWLGQRVGAVSFLTVLAVTLCGIIFRESVSPAKFGVVLSYMILSTSTLTRLVGSLTEAVLLMNTVERVQYYTELSTEASPKLPSDPPKDLWPGKGEITFKDVSMRYREELPMILQRVNFTVCPGEKIGIIGRTGSGKSSLTQALFRLTELSNDEEREGYRGKIEIDGIDISKLGLETLRGRLSIIPQDPFLFSGSIRDNIDPQGDHSDAELNEFLSLLQNDSDTSMSLRQKLHLDFQVINQGANLSAGERQLIALLRAIVKKPKILVMDEATSSVDPETDSLIQKIIRTELERVTLISIAHRIQTIMNYDKILIMDQGEVVEFDRPRKLFEDPSSIFRGFCDKSGLSISDFDL